MIESKFTYTSVMPDCNDPLYSIEPEPVPALFIFDDDDDEDDSFTPDQRMFGLYGDFYTSAERKALKAIPDGDLSNEINLLKSMLVDTFALMPTGPEDKKHPLTPEFEYDLFAICCRTVIVLTRLVALDRKINGSRNRTADLSWEALGEMDPQNLNEGIDDEDDGQT